MPEINRDLVDRHPTEQNGSPVLLARLMAQAFPWYAASWRLQVEQPDGCLVSGSNFSPGSDLFAYSDQASLILARFLSQDRFLMMVAPGKDGDWVTEAVSTTGSTVIRGSSRQGGPQALIRMIQCLKRSPLPAALCVDGTVGPLRSVGPGIVLCASRTGRSILPVGAAARPAIQFKKSWTHMVLPLPLARVLIVCGPAIRVSSSADRCEVENIRCQVQAAMADVQNRAEEMLGS